MLCICIYIYTIITHSLPFGESGYMVKTQKRKGICGHVKSRRTNRYSYLEYSHNISWCESFPFTHACTVAS